MNKLPIELHQKIYENLEDLRTKIRYTQINKYIKCNVLVRDFNNIEEKYLRLLNDRILKSYPNIQLLMILQWAEFMTNKTNSKKESETSCQIKPNKHVLTYEINAIKK